MKYRIIATKIFEKQLKRLSKKFPSLKNDLLNLEKLLIENPRCGASLGKNAYKIRLAVKSKAKGKSGGLRVISYLELDYILQDMTNIFLLTIYDKSETGAISNSEITRLIESKN